MKIYAKAEKVPEGRDYITAGKLYEVTQDYGDGFECYDNVSDLLFCLWEGCCHLDFGDYFGNWIRIEAGTLEELNLKEGDVIQCVEEVDCGWAATEGLSYTVYSNDVIDIDKEFWHEVKHLFTVVSRAEETKENSMKEPKFKVGDKVRSVNNLYSFCGTVGVVDSVGDYGLYYVCMPHDNNVYYHFEHELDTVEDTQVEQPKTWAHLTDEEKGALLLAYHEGKPIEWFYDEALMHGSSTYKGSKPMWDDICIYRIKPSPVIEEKEEGMKYNANTKELNFDEHLPQFKLKYRLVDGKLDEDSVSVVKVSSQNEVE